MTKAGLTSSLRRTKLALEAEDKVYVKTNETTSVQVNGIEVSVVAGRDTLVPASIAALLESAGFIDHPED
jgi:hypothetical protein